ncbi:DUF1824 family protein [Leptolyngbya sp. FACHB-16]|uniref:DUF1824 family protein n=1 Tax=unclassified Leptolyngbya TaxID=2650499 RepID=UPI001685EDA1|nr:DUF1824 family protein [Leptolyngbya sp. FACHB-16]MBD2154644.1 DUF1824 family protein [Leptolyngbya sp. FACHB-16]
MELSSTPLTSLEEADRLLKQFDCLTPERSQSLDHTQVQAALQLVAQHSDYQMLGVCADSLTQAQSALRAYATALGYAPDLAVEAPAGPVYLKFNSRSNRCYADGYPGQHRGVLVSCQSADADGINQMYGHLPLNLFSAE